MAVAMVRARSCAEMPVATPSRASIDTVNAVRVRASFWRAMYSSRSWSARWRVSDRQMRPRPCLAMKLMTSGVAICAGIDEVALVLAVLGVDQDDHAAVAQVLEDLVDGREKALAFGVGHPLQVRVHRRNSIRRAT